MFQRLIDDFRDGVGQTARMTALVVAVAVSLFVTTAFLCAAAFVAVLHRYGLVEACLAGAGIFFVVTLLAAGLYAARKRQIAKRMANLPKQAKSSIQSMMPDPMMIASALPLIRAIGFKKLVPILAIGALALGFIAARSAGDSEDETDDTLED
jgi:hypothetical protein